MKHDSPIPTNRRRSAARPSFTLVELLVVIAIIAILSAMAAWGVFAMIGGQQNRNTQSTITVVNKVMQSHWKYVIDEAKIDEISQANNLSVYNMAQPDPTGQRFRVLWIKFRLMEAFPQKFTEISAPFVYTDPGTGPYIPVNQRRYISDYQTKIANRVVANTKPMTESSACLLLALSVNRGGNALNQDQIKFAIKDSDGDGIPEIVDSFAAAGDALDPLKNTPPLSANPLAFFRFPVGSNPALFPAADVARVTASGSNLQAANPATGQAANPATWSRPFKFSDPVDTEGTLMNTSWYFRPPPANAPNPMRTIFETDFHTIALTAPPAPTARANYVLPIIVSAGKNGRFGLNVDATGHFKPDMSIPHAAPLPPRTPAASIPILIADEADNIYSHQLRGN